MREEELDQMSPAAGILTMSGVQQRRGFAARLAKLHENGDGEGTSPTPNLGPGDYFGKAPRPTSVGEARTGPDILGESDLLLRFRRKNSKDSAATTQDGAATKPLE